MFSSRSARRHTWGRGSSRHQTRRLGTVLMTVLLVLGLWGPVPARAELLHPRQEWLRDSNIGLFLHWGMRTGPAQTDCETWERAVTEGGWTADYWVDEAIKLHAQYLVFASFHSRLGYARAWPSEIPGSCSTERDFLGELVAAAKAEGVKVILYMTDDPQWWWEGLPQGESWSDSGAYSAYAGHPVNLHTRDGFGEFSWDNFVEVMQNYPDLAGFWIDNDNAYWERNGLYELIRERRPNWLLSNNNENTPIMDTVSNEQKSGMTPSYDYPAAVWSPQPRLTEACFTIGGHWWFQSSNPNPTVNYPLTIGRVITNAGSSIKSLIAEGAMQNGRFPPNLEAFNNYMADYLTQIWESIGGTEGGGYMYGGLQPGWINDGGFAVTTVKKNNPDQHYVHIPTKPSTGDTVRVRDNGYKVTAVFDVRTGEQMLFNQSGGYLSITGITAWDSYDTVFEVSTDGRQFIHEQREITATASASRSGFPAANLTDGDFLTYWDNGGTLPVSIDLDLGETKPARYLTLNQREWSVSYVRSTGEDSARIKDYRVHVSDDGQTWGPPVKTGRLESARGVRLIDIGNQQARHIRLEVLSTWAAQSASSFYRQLRIDEMYVGHHYPYSAKNPLPNEAEATGNTLTGTARIVVCPACSGGRKVSSIGGGPDNSVTVNNVFAPEAGDYRLTVFYTVNGTRSFLVSVNGGDPITVPASGTNADVPERTAVAVSLRSGANSIKFSNDTAPAPDLDRISIGPLPPSYAPKTTVTVAPAHTWTGPGRSFEVSGQFRVDDVDPMTDVTFAPQVPDGWTIDGAPSTAAWLEPGQTLTGTWTLTTPPDSDFGVIDIPIVASFRALGRPFTNQRAVRVELLPPGFVFIGEGEAPGNTFSGSARPDGCAGCSGGQKVRFIGNSPNNHVTVDDVVVIDEAGEYVLFIDYTLDGNRSFFVSVNGGPGVEVPLTGTNWNVPTSASITVPLSAGANTIRFYNNTANAPDLDRIRIAVPN